MSDRKLFKDYIFVDRDLDEVSDVHNEIINMLTRQLTQKAIDIMQDGNDYIISVSNAIGEEDGDLIQYRQYVSVAPLVRCGDCKYIRPTGINGLYECVRMQLATKKDEFCSRGDRKDG